MAKISETIDKGISYAERRLSPSIETFQIYTPNNPTTPILHYGGC